MAKQTASFVDLHIEKIVIGVCALILVGTVGYYFVGTPYAVDDKGPTELCAEARDVAERTRSSVNTVKYEPGKPTPGQAAEGMGALSELARWFGDNAEGLIRIAGLTMPAPRTQAFSTPLLNVGGVAEDERHGLAKLVAPGVPIVTTGKSFLDMPIQSQTMGGRVGGGGAARATTESVEKSWVSVGAQVDLYAQLQNFVAAGYAQGGGRSLPIIRVHLQRKALGEGTDWEDVNGFSPVRIPAKPRVQFEGGRVASATQKELGEFQQTVRRNQEMIARPPLPEQTPETRGDQPVAAPLPYYPDPPGSGEETDAARAKEWLSLAQKAMDGKKPFGEADPDSAAVLAGAAMASPAAKGADRERARKLFEDARAACKQKKRPAPPSQPQEPEWLMPIVAHDLDVTEGQTYVYRMRYEILNNFVGDPVRMRNRADAERLTLISDWSPPSRPVEVKSDIYYYLTSDNARNNEVTFTIYKRVAGGEWLPKTSKVKVGDMIGKKERNADFSTGMMCIDIDFKPPNAKNRDVSVVLVSTQDGNLWERRKLNDSAQEKDRFGGRRR